MTHRTCTVDGCDRPHQARGYCLMHYTRVRRSGNPGPSTPLIQYREGLICTVAGCDRRQRGHGCSYCEMHRTRVRRTGTPGAALPRNEVNKGRRCAVEGCDRPSRVKQMCDLHYSRVRLTGEPGPLLPKRAPNGTGSINAFGYRVVSRSGEKVLEHRWVMEQRLGRKLRQHESVHHINGVRTDNRPDNLELWASAHLRGQRVADLAAWVVENYRDEVLDALTWTFNVQASRAIPLP